MGVTLSERAAKEIQKIMDDQSSPEGTFIRVGVTGGGCSGFSYSLNWDTESQRTRPRRRFPRRQAGRRQEVRPVP